MAIAKRRIKRLEIKLNGIFVVLHKVHGTSWQPPNYWAAIRKDPCVYCGSAEEPSKEHLVPRCRGGKDSWENCVSACVTCNVKRGQMKGLMNPPPLWFYALVQGRLLKSDLLPLQD